MRRTLKGRSILVTRTARGNKEWKEYFEKAGAKVYSFPAIKTVTVSLTAGRRALIGRLNDFDWIVFTSAEGFRSFLRLVAGAHVSLRTGRMPKIAAIGNGTATAVRAAGYKISFRPSNADSATIGKEIAPIKKCSVLLPQADIASSALAKALAARGATVTPFVAYKTISAKHPIGTQLRKFLLAHKIDHVLFASPSAIKGFCGGIPKKDIRFIKDVAVIAIGKDVQGVAKRAGFTHVAVSKEPTAGGMADAMVRSAV
jgi:uroporphyrinogen III methyltransferase/synthase